MRKGHLLKYLKKKVLLGSMEKSQEAKRMIIKVTNGGAAKDPGTSGSAKDLNIVWFMGKDNEEKDKKYDRYAAKREGRNLRTKALRRYVFGILEEGVSNPES